MRAEVQACGSKNTTRITGVWNGWRTEAVITFVDSGRACNERSYAWKSRRRSIASERVHTALRCELLTAMSRASVMGPPPDLAAIVARAERGGDGAPPSWDDTPLDGQFRGTSEPADWMVEEAQREAEVARQQAAYLEKQLKGAVAELELHKRHGREFKQLLEQSEADLCASHEHAADLQQRLQLAQEGNRRNSDMAQQLLKHLNSTRVELKAQTRKNAQLEADLAKATEESAGGGAPGAPSSASAMPQRLGGDAPPPAAGNGHEGARGKAVDVSDGGASGRANDGANKLDARTSKSEAASAPPLLARLASRAALTPVTHDVGVQADLRSGRELASARMGNLAKLAVEHARELDRDGAQRAMEAVNMEARPTAAAAADGLPPPPPPAEDGGGASGGGGAGRAGAVRPAGAARPGASSPTRVVSGKI